MNARDHFKQVVIAVRNIATHDDTSEKEVLAILDELIKLAKDSKEIVGKRAERKAAAEKNFADTVATSEAETKAKK